MKEPIVDIIQSCDLCGMYKEFNEKNHKRWHVFTAHWHYEGKSTELIPGCDEDGERSVYWKHCCRCGLRQRYENSGSNLAGLH